MENNVNYIQAMNFCKSIFVWNRDKRNSKENKAEYRKMGLWFFMMYFDCWISVILSQNAN